jgi:hydrogenase/urease accessory protein HupE
MKLNLRRLFILVGVFFFFPTLAHAHSAGGSLNGWHDGFNHPLHGWDHLIAMLAVGIWAAHQRGRAVWLIPLTFVGVMCVGGIVGAAGVSLPGVELAISLSVVVFVALVARRARLQLGVSAAIVGFFAFFHGFAHGAEMPSTVSLLTFGFGFLVATLLLHGVGLVAARGVALMLAFSVGSSAMAQEVTNAPSIKPEQNSEAPVRLPEVVVEGRADSLVGVADSATQGTVGAKQLEDRPILRSGEILETVPGVIITQHAGGGKANQYFLRGFNLDHGTDFATFLDGMPLNLPTHGHGQGYSDMNIVIPELVQRVNYQKGIYYAENGDFSSAGAAHLEFFKTLPQDIAIVEGGTYGYARGVFASSPKLGDGRLLYGIEAYHDDGPWKRPDDYKKFNGILTYSQGDEANNFSVTFHGYHGEWNSSDQIASIAVNTGFVPLFGSLDDTTGGNSQRYSLQAEWNRAGPGSATKVIAYGFYYDLDLFSDFTYFLTDTNRGDQFEQTDKRYVAGLDARHTLFNQWARRDVENTFGLQVRNDWIRNGLFQTQDRVRVDKVDSQHDDFLLPATTRADDIMQTSVSLFYENKIQWAERFRTVAGVRGDVFNFDVNSTRPENSDDRLAAIASPKLSLIFGPWAKTEIYVQGGLGYHSNDGRGATTRVDPVTGASTNLDGETVKRADPLVQTYGAEIGLRTTYVPGLQSTLSFWWLDIDSELVFAGDAGTTEASRPSRRYGVEWANYYNVTKHLSLDVDFSFSHAEFRDNPIDTTTGQPIGREIPGSVESVIAAGITYHADCGFFSSLRLRYFGPRPLIEDNSFRSKETILLNAQVGYKINKTWTVSAEVLNLLDRRDHDIDYAYESRISPTASPTTEIHFHPVEPIQVRFALTAKF